MTYRELIKRVQRYSGFSDKESKDALDCTVEVLSVHLTNGERKDFASQLPAELKAIAMTVNPTDELARQDPFQQFVQVQKIEAARAKKQLLSAWRALKDAISEGEIAHIRAQLPNKTVVLLHQSSSARLSE